MFKTASPFVAALALAMVSVPASTAQAQELRECKRVLNLFTSCWTPDAGTEALAKYRGGDNEPMNGENERTAVSRTTTTFAEEEDDESPNLNLNEISPAL